LVIENVTTDPNNALLRDLAHRLHRHRIAAVHVTRGATLTEIEELLSAVSSDPQRGDGALGKRLDQVGPWEHIRLRPVGYDKFALQDEAGETEGPDEPSSERDSWIELAQLALASEQRPNAREADPLVMAEAIGRKSGEVAYDRVVLGYLARVADEMSRRRGGAEDKLTQRISKLIQALDSDTLQRLLEASADQAEQRQFVLNASQILAADAVIEVVEAAAQVSHQTISHNLLRLLHKLAHHAEDGPTAIRAAADGALRTNVARLIGDWELEDPNPDEYTAVLERMARRTSGEFAAATPQMGCDPDVILRMALELECVGPAVYAAVEDLLLRGELVRVAAYLDTARQSDTRDKLWRYIATPERLERELAGSPLDQEAVRVLVERMGESAANSLLDRLATADDRSTRAAVLKQLLALGPRAGELAVLRLEGAPWFVQRNILFLLGRLGSWPEGFSPHAYAESPDPRIRREAIKLLLDSPAHQPQTILRGLADADEGIVALSLAAALDSCPADALSLVHSIAVDAKRPAEVRVLAVRILARSKSPASVEVLQSLVLHRRRWFGRRLAPKSPELLAALSGLATHWREHPVAAEVLAHAMQHADPEIRAAASSAPA
ncbi:MAG TPA: hypothetical protein VHK68_05840, partial [Gemmatimonadales bacterium]|nr:hypothetical protein [Gemmatimonadales bacterium]